jgi:hypothetical protein
MAVQISEVPLRTWGHSGEAIYAIYQGDESGDHILMIETALSSNSEDVVVE